MQSVSRGQSGRNSSANAFSQKHGNAVVRPHWPIGSLAPTLLSKKSQQHGRNSYFFLAESGGSRCDNRNEEPPVWSSLLLPSPLDTSNCLDKAIRFPWDPRIWVALGVHDFGYFTCPNMDGAEGEQHVWLGSKIMSSLFDRAVDRTLAGRLSRFCNRVWGYRPEGQSWAHFCLFHSRSFAKRRNQPVSRLCVADKLAFAVTPRWLYLPMVTWTEEIREYLENAQRCQTEWSEHAKGIWQDSKAWHRSLRIELLRWVAQYRRDARQGNATCASGYPRASKIAV